MKNTIILAILFFTWINQSNADLINYAYCSESGNSNSCLVYTLNVENELSENKDYIESLIIIDLFFISLWIEPIFIK